jgi:plasmid stabilization system protein ParE
MGLKLVLHRRVERDLRGIQAYLLEEAGAQSAERVRAHLHKMILRLAGRPYAGRATSMPEIRILPSTRYQYRVYYTVTAEAVIILHIRHSARRDPVPDDLKR